MNAIIISAVWGIVMMFSGILTRNKRSIRFTAILGLLLLCMGNWMDMNDQHFFNIDTHRMLDFETFGLLASSIAFVSFALIVEALR